MKKQTLHSNAANIYQVGSEYRRFDQKYNLMIQSKWNPPIKKLDELREKNFRRLVANQKTGYSIYDQAYLNGGLHYLQTSGFGINFCDQGANKWTNSSLEEKHQYISQDPELTNVIKKACVTYGASDVGIAELDRRWVYSHWYDIEKNDSFPIVFSDDVDEYQSILTPTVLADGTRVIPSSINKAIVFMVEMDCNKLKYSPTALSFGESVQAYSKLVLITLSMTGFIRSLGYEAIPSINCTALNVPLAIDAGLGQMGRNGKVIHPQFGAKTRIAKILTNLPLEADEPIDFGVTQFCDTCKKCSRKCPPNAISDKERTNLPVDETGNPHYLRWQVDYKKCYSYWSECGTNCNICLYVCPYNRGYKWTSKAMSFSTNHKNDLVSQILHGIGEISNIEHTEFDTNAFWSKEK